MKKDIKIPLVEKIQVLAAFEWDKDFLSKTPNPTASPKSFEQDIQMGLKEGFLDPGEEYLKRLKSPENEQNPYIQGGLLAPLGDPKFFKYFFHMVII